jgi:acetyl-CoA carboxylase biotin carboxylase subunit
LGVRVDAGIFAGYVVPPHYDSMIAKLIVHADTRLGAIRRMERALAELAIVGIKTVTPLHLRILADPDFRRGDYTIHWLEKFVAQQTPG